MFLLLGELVYFFVNFTFLVAAFVSAIHVALIFATLFSYLALKMHVQSRKLAKMVVLKQQFLFSWAEEIAKPLSGGAKNSAYYLSMAQGCCIYAAELHGKEYSLYPCPAFCEPLSSSVEKFSCWLHWRDVHFMKEQLLGEAIDQHIQLVRLYPTNLEAHAGLANSYVMLSGIYVDPRTVEGMDGERWIPSDKYNDKLRKKFRATAERAIEEFKILNDYAPEDPWVHAQLAYSYCDLQMPFEEIKEYETILRLCPEDQETLFKLGRLYFEQGLNAKGLEVYEILKTSNPVHAESLIHYYGAFQGINGGNE